MCLHALTHTVESSWGGVCVCVCAFLCESEGGWVGFVESSGCISIQQWLPIRSVWEVGRREGGGDFGQGNPFSEQNSAMGWNKAARRGTA